MCDRAGCLLTAPGFTVKTMAFPWLLSPQERLDASLARASTAPALTAGAGAGRRGQIATASAFRDHRDRDRTKALEDGTSSHQKSDGDMVARPPQSDC